jgi:hypothetical protein
MFSCAFCVFVAGCFLARFFAKIALLNTVSGRRLTQFASGLLALGRFLTKRPGVPAGHPPGLSRRARRLADGGRVFYKDRRVLQTR